MLSGRNVACFLAICLSTARLDAVATQPTRDRRSSPTSSSSLATERAIGFDGTAELVNGRLNVRVVVPANAVSTERNAATFSILPTDSRCPILRSKEACSAGATIVRNNSCPGGQDWKCPNHPTCIPLAYRCDGEEHQDCPDGADEAPALCFPTTTSTTTTTTSVLTSTTATVTLSNEEGSGASGASGGSGEGSADDGGSRSGSGPAESPPETASSTTTSSTSTSTETKTTRTDTTTTVTFTTTITLYQPNQCKYQLPTTATTTETVATTVAPACENDQWECTLDGTCISKDYVCDDYDPPDCAGGEDEDEAFCVAYKATEASTTSTTTTTTTTTVLDPSETSDDDHDDDQHTCKKPGDEGQWKCPGEDKSINCDYVCDDYDPPDCTELGGDEDPEFCEMWKAASASDDDTPGDNPPPNDDTAVSDDTPAGDDIEPSDDTTVGDDLGPGPGPGGPTCQKPGDEGQWKCPGEDKSINCNYVCDDYDPPDCAESLADEDPEFCEIWKASASDDDTPNDDMVVSDDKPAGDDMEPTDDTTVGDDLGPGPGPGGPTCQKPGDEGQWQCPGEDKTIDCDYVCDDYDPPDCTELGGDEDPDFCEIWKASTSDDDTPSLNDDMVASDDSIPDVPDDDTYADDVPGMGDDVYADDTPDTNDDVYTDGAGDDVDPDELTCQKPGDEGQWQCPGEDKTINCDYVCDDYDPPDCTELGGDEDPDFCEIWKASATDDYADDESIGDDIPTSFCEKQGDIGNWQCPDEDTMIDCERVCDGAIETDCSLGGDEDPVFCATWMNGNSVGDSTTTSTTLSGDFADATAPIISNNTANATSTTSTTTTTIGTEVCEWKYNACDGVAAARAADVELVDICSLGAADRSCGEGSNKVFRGSIVLPQTADDTTITVKLAVVNSTGHPRTLKIDVAPQTTPTTSTTRTTVQEALCMDVPFFSGSAWHDSGGRSYNCKWYGASARRRCVFADTPEGINEGISAKDACCACGGGILFGPENEADCEDRTDNNGGEWHDLLNDVHTCAAYAGCDGETDWCSVYGSANISANNGMMAADACCVCGGGERDMDVLARRWRVRSTAPPPVVTTVSATTTTSASSSTVTTTTSNTGTTTTVSTTTTQTRLLCNDTLPSCVNTALNGGCIFSGALGEAVRKACPWSCNACIGTSTSVTTTPTTTAVTTPTTQTEASSSTATTSTTTPTTTAATASATQTESSTSTATITTTTTTTTPTSTATSTPTSLEIIYDELCTAGIISNNKKVCCASSCGQCGGGDCLAMEGGVLQCCISVIQLNNIQCVGRDTGCLLPELPTDSTSPTTTAMSSATTTASSTPVISATSTATSTPTFDVIAISSVAHSNLGMENSLAIAISVFAAVLILVALFQVWKTRQEPQSEAPVHIHVNTAFEEQLSSTFV